MPAAIRKQTGRSRIGRVFRDHEELPATSDLQDNIADALDHSDYLIVICSPDTKESVWVQREIAFFLRTHDSSRVLTVLSGGEDPTAVIPEILLYEEKDGKKQPREPLSCDYRGDLKKAGREELPRLAAVLLGCSYDDLRQRQRQYRTRQVLTVLAAALILVSAGSGYLLWSRRQIRENLRQSQISESRYLAAAAMEEFRDGNRILAARLALEALPSEEDPARPVSAEAVRALSEALYACRIPVNMTVGAVRVFDTSARVERLKTDEERHRVLALDETGVVHVWETETGKEILTIAAGRLNWADLLTDSEGRIILISEDELRCYDGETGRQLWTVKDTIDYFAANLLIRPSTLFSWCLSPDGKKLYFTKKTDWSSGEKMLVTVDTGTGQILKEEDTSNASEKEQEASSSKDTDTWYAGGMAVSSDDERLAVLEKTFDDRYRLVISGDDEGAFIRVQLPFRDVHAMSFDCRGQIIICGQSTAAEETSDVPQVLSLTEELDTAGRYEAVFACYGTDGRQLWETSFPVTMDNQFSAVYSGTFRAWDTDSMEEYDACLLGNAVLFADPDSGKERGSYLLPSRIVSGEVCPPAVRVTVRSGEMAYLYPGEEKTYLNRYFTNNIEDAAYMGGYLANDDEAAVCTLNEGRRELILYEGGIGDDSFEFFEGDSQKVKDMFPLVTQTEDSRCIMLATELSDWKTAVHVLDLKNKCIDRIIDLPGGSNDYRWIRFSPEKDILTLVRTTGWNLAEEPAECVQVRVTDGNISETVIPVSDGSRQASLEDAVSGGDEVFLLVNYDNMNAVYGFLPDTGELRTLYSEDEKEPGGSRIQWIFPSDSGRHMLLVYDTGEILAEDTETCETCYFEWDIFRNQLPYTRENVHVAWNEDESVFILTYTDSEEICIAGSDGTVKSVIPCPGKSPESVYILNGEVCVLFGDASVEKYAVTNGTFEGRIELGKGEDVYSTGPKEWKPAGEHELIIRSGGTLYIADMQAGVCTQKVEGCMGYSETERMFLMNFSSYDTDMPYGWYDRSELDDLIRKGREMTEGQAISFEDRIKYALGAESS